MGQHWMDNASTPFIIYDDLSKQAEDYTPAGLLLRRPPGREATRATILKTSTPAVEREAKDVEELGAARSPPRSRDKAGECRPTSDQRDLSITDGQVYLQAGPCSKSGACGGHPSGHLGVRVGGAAPDQGHDEVRALKIDLARVSSWRRSATFESELDKISAASRPWIQAPELLKQNLTSR